MAGTKEIKRRIKSVRSTKKITKAMELVAASKMKRAVNSTLNSRLYAEYSSEILNSIAKNVEEIKNPLFNERDKKEEKKNILLFLITSNRGLCGAYNAQAIKKALAVLKESDVNMDIVSIGRKGDLAMRRIGRNVIASFSELPDNITLGDVTPIAQLAIDEFLAGHYDKVLVDYTDYISALTQKAHIRQILPISKTELKEILEAEPLLRGSASQSIDYLFEGDFDMLISSLAGKITKTQVYQMILESNASEQSSRMLAMKNASDASGEMIDDLTLMFNKARQSNITREISEISAGMASVS